MKSLQMNGRTDNEQEIRKVDLSSGELKTLTFYPIKHHSLPFSDNIRLPACSCQLLLNSPPDFQTTSFSHLMGWKGSFLRLKWLSPALKLKNCNLRSIDIFTVKITQILKKIKKKVYSE